MKISDNQIKVINLMHEGWQLGCMSGYRSSAWLQKGGIGKGGETFKVLISTFRALVNDKLIAREKEGYPVSTYALTQKGRQFQKLYNQQ